MSHIALKSYRVTLAQAQRRSKCANCDDSVFSPGKSVAPGSTKLVFNNFGIGPHSRQESFCGECAKEFLRAKIEEYSCLLNEFAKNPAGR